MGWITAVFSTISDANHFEPDSELGELFPMAMQAPSPQGSENPVYELRHLRRTLSRLESTHAPKNSVIQNLTRNVVNRIRELEIELGHVQGTEYTD